MGRGHPQEVDVDSQHQGMEADGRVCSRAHARTNEESFLSHFKKKIEIDFEFEEKSMPMSSTSMGFVTWSPFSLSWFWHPPVILEIHPFLFLTLIMIIIELTSPPITGVGMWFIGALLSSSRGDIIQPVTLWEL